jgi:hypothetical protein
VISFNLEIHARLQWTFVFWIIPLLETLSTKQTSNENLFTFCRLPGFNCVLSIILIATWKKKHKFNLTSFQQKNVPSQVYKTWNKNLTWKKQRLLWMATTQYIKHNAWYQWFFIIRYLLGLYLFILLWPIDSLLGNNSVNTSHSNEKQWKPNRGHPLLGNGCVFCMVWPEAI